MKRVFVSGLKGNKLFSKVTLFMVAFLMILPVSAVFAGGSSDGQQKVVLRWGTTHSETTIATQMMRRIIQEVNSRTEGRVEIQGFPNGALGSSRDVVEGVYSGMVDMTSENASQFSAWVPMASIADAPYIYRDIDHMNKVFNGEFGVRLNEEFLKKNVRIAGVFYYGTRQLSTTNKEIRSVSDMQGLKIRVPEIKSYIEMINSWGARPTPMTLGDLYFALSTNVVDGQENPLPTFDGQKFYEVQKYVILTNHIINGTIIFLNNDSWKKISPADQKIFQEAVNNGIAWNNAETIKGEENLKKTLVEKGVTVITPDVESFRAVTAPWLIKTMEADWGKGMWEYIQNIK